MILEHPITHANQQFICPSDAATNDDVGQVTRGLVTHADFFFQRWGIQLIDSDYKCSIQSGNSDGAFALDVDTGDLTIPIPSNFTATRNLVIRVYIDQMHWYYMDTTCEILYIPAADCIYFDVDFVGTSDGSRSAPYIRYSDNVYGGAAWGLTSIPGKTFLWRRGKTWTNEWTVTNTGTNEATLPIRFGAYGQGVRPIIDLSLNSTSERFAQVGLASMAGPAEDFKMSNNIYYYDFDITHDNSNDAYPVQVVPMGRFIEFHRMKMTNCTFPEGFMWFAGPFAYPYVDRNILIRDIFTYEHGIDVVGGGGDDWPRAIKMETGGSNAENIYCETSKNYHSAAFSGGATRQNVTTKYVKAKANVSLSGELFGMEVRNVSQQHQWVVLDGVDYGLTIFGFKGQISGEEVVPDSTSGFSDVILKNIGVLDVTTINQTILDMDGVYIKNVISNESSGVLIGGSTQCINTKLQNLLLTNSTTLSDAEIQVGSSGFQNQNGATLIENCLCGRIDNYDNQTIVRNTIYDAIIETQTAVKTTNISGFANADFMYEGSGVYIPPTTGAQVGAGTASTLLTDLYGKTKPSPPSIGPLEPNEVTVFSQDPKNGTQLFYSGFEAGVTEWNTGGELDTSYIPATGDSSIVTTQKFNWGFSLKMTSDNDLGQTNNFRYTEPNDNTDFIATFNLYFPAKIDLANNFDSYFNLIQTKGVNEAADPLPERNDPIWVMGLGVRGGKGTGGNNYLTLAYLGQFWPELGVPQQEQTSLATLDIPIAKWFTVQIRYLKSENNGVVQVWQDDTLLFEKRQGITFPDSLVARLYMSVNNYGEERLPAGGQTDVYLDDASVNLLNGSYDFGDLTLTLNSGGNGTVAQSPTGIHGEGDEIELSATADSGYEFEGWYDGVTLLSVSNPYTYTMPATDKTITGQFAADTPTEFNLVLQVDPAWAGSAEQSPASPHETGTSVTLTATANPSYLFLGWYDGATELSTDNPYIYTTTGENKIITAKFEINLSGPFIKKGKWATKII